MGLRGNQRSNHFSCRLSVVGVIGAVGRGLRPQGELGRQPLAEVQRFARAQAANLDQDLPAGQLIPLDGRLVVAFGNVIVERQHRRQLFTVDTEPGRNTQVHQRPVGPAVRQYGCGQM